VSVRSLARIHLVLALGLLVWRSEAQTKYQLKTGATIEAADFASVQVEGISFRTSGVGVVSKRYRWNEFTTESLRQLLADIQGQKRITVRPTYPRVLQEIQKVLQAAGAGIAPAQPPPTNRPGGANKSLIQPGVQPGGMTVTPAGKNSQLKLQSPTGLPENFARTFDKKESGISYAALAAVAVLLMGTIGLGVYQTVRFYGKIEAERQAAPHKKQQAEMESAQVTDLEPPPPSSPALAPVSPQTTMEPPPSTVGGVRIFTRDKSTFNRRFMEMKMMNFLKLNPAGNEYLVVKVDDEEYWGRRIAGLSEESMALEVAAQNVWEQREVAYEDIDEIEIRPAS